MNHHAFPLVAEHPANDILLDAATADPAPPVFAINTALRATGVPRNFRVWELTDRKLHVQTGRHWQPLDSIAADLLN